MNRKWELDGWGLCCFPVNGGFAAKPSLVLWFKAFFSQLPWCISNSGCICRRLFHKEISQH